MQIFALRPGRALLAAAAVGMLALPATAAARPIGADLHVEAGNHALEGGARFLNDTAHIHTDAGSDCGGSGQVKTVQGPTALGILPYAESRVRALRPVSVSDQFSVCGIGSFRGNSSTKSWLYKVNHRTPSVGADQFHLKKGDQVLWYFQDTATGENTGSELSLVGPARARRGHAFEVTVFSYTANGARSRVPGAQVVVGNTVKGTTDSAGHAMISSSHNGFLRLRARHGLDIPSTPLSVCVNRVLSRCPAVRGKHIIGTRFGDRIRGTRGADLIEGRGGNDRINVVGGGRDRVRCGRGHDRVRLGRGDRAAADCEVVIRRRRRS
jgi:hypothetical protein